MLGGDGRLALHQAAGASSGLRPVPAPRLTRSAWFRARPGSARCASSRFLDEIDHVVQFKVAHRFGDLVIGLEGRSPSSRRDPSRSSENTSPSIAPRPELPAQVVPPPPETCSRMVGVLGGVQGLHSARRWHRHRPRAYPYARNCPPGLIVREARRRPRSPSVGLVLGHPILVVQHAPPPFRSPRLCFAPNIGVTRAAIPTRGASGEKTCLSWFERLILVADTGLCGRSHSSDGNHRKAARHERPGAVLLAASAISRRWARRTTCARAIRVRR